MDKRLGLLIETANLLSRYTRKMVEQSTVNSNQSLSYANKHVLAPMVRIGTLPVRLLSLRYGADIVYCEEIIDFKMLQATRMVNKVLGTVDYRLSDGDIVFRTCEEEREKLVFQMGTSDPERAVRVARMVEQDVSGIDVNMGCPKDYSIKGGMGAALLSHPDKIKAILEALVAGVKIPVTCKIRILPSIEETINLAKMIEKTGVKAIGVHGRRKEERSSEPCHNDIIKQVAQALSIPVIANGGSNEINKYEDIIRFRDETAASSVMVARAAQWNPSVFRKEGLLPVEDVLKEVMKIAIDYDNEFVNTKYIVCKMIREVCKNEVGIKLAASRDIEDIASALGLSEYYQNSLNQRNKREGELSDENGPSCKRRKTESYIEMDVTYNKKLYPRTVSPKQIVYEYSKKMGWENPVFETIRNEKDDTFKSVLNLNKFKYSSVLSGKNKRVAEQLAAKAFLSFYNMHDGRLK